MSHITLAVAVGLAASVAALAAERTAETGSSAGPPPWWLARPDRTEPAILRWAKEHPKRVSLRKRKTFGGRAAYSVTVTGGEGSGKKMRLLVAQPHAHEPAATAGMMDILSQLITGKDLAGRATALDRERVLARMVVTCIPDGNPDGRSRAPEAWWDGTKHTNDEFLKVAFGRMPDGTRCARLGRWSLDDRKPAAVGIVYEQINATEFVEPNRDRDSTYFRLVAAAVKDGPPDRFLSLHQTEFERSKYNAMIILPFMQAELPEAIRRTNERWGLAVIEAWSKAGAAAMSKPRPLGYREDQLKYFRKCWSDLYGRTPTITVEIQNNNTRTPPRVQMDLQAAAIRVTIEQMLAGKKE
jgi:hypothetical protein